MMAQQRLHYSRARSVTVGIDIIVWRALIIQSIKFTRAKKSEKRRTPSFFRGEKKDAQSLHWVDDDEAAYDVEK